MILDSSLTKQWKVEKIGVIGPGIVGMPMAALLADANVRIGSELPAKVVVIQRNSRTSGWKVDAINSGKSVIGGIEPGLDEIVKRAVSNRTLKASNDFDQLTDADVILVCVQTDKKEFEPDYGPMMEALSSLARALVKKPAGKKPLIIFESTLAPSSMLTVIRDHFESFGLIEGQDLLLVNSPNRLMPGRLVERVIESDKIVGGLQPGTSALIKKLYSFIVTKGELCESNCMTAEIEKTLENAYRDVRIAFSSEIAGYCDEHGIDYYAVREKVNERLKQTDSASTEPNAVPTGGLLIPNVGVGGHCLPKDGILLWWRKIESGQDTSNSLILRSRKINDASPSKFVHLAENISGKLDGSKIALLGAAYRFNSEDTRNSPTFQLAKLLIDKGCSLRIHDPFVKPDDQNIIRNKLGAFFTNNLSFTLEGVEYIMICTAHHFYIDQFNLIRSQAANVKGLFDGCNIFHEDLSSYFPFKYGGIGRGKLSPPDLFIDFVYDSFIAMERGMGNELNSLIKFLNDHYSKNKYNEAEFMEIQKLAATCSTCCEIADAGQEILLPQYEGFSSELVKLAYQAQNT